MGFIGSTTVLGANATFTSPVQLTDRADTLTGSVFSDQAGTLYIEQSGDGTNWDISNSHAVTASTGQGFSEPLYDPYVRLRYVNGGTLQGAFRLNARFSSAGPR